MQVIHSAHKLAKLCSEHREAGRRVGLVPTMGYLHDGHLSLVETLRPKVDILVASIFVNPTQFGPQEDLNAYPRDEEGDLKKLSDANVDIAFLPTPEEIYQESGEVLIAPPAVASRLCGASRPGHFSGVCTVVMKLFRLSRCTEAIFGEKDFQQLQVLRAMNRQLWLGINILGGPIVREIDGLAMSSRNAYLDGRERELSLCLSQALYFAKQRYQASVRGKEQLAPEALREEIEAQIPTELGKVEVDYVEVVDPTTLLPATNLDSETRVILAVKIGKTRLIDNANLSLSDTLSAANC